MAHQIKFSLRSLFAALTIGICVFGIGFRLWSSLPDAYPAAVRNEYVNGRITLDEARKKVGSVAVTWQPYRERFLQRIAGSRDANGAENKTELERNLE